VYACSLRTVGPDTTSALLCNGVICLRLHDRASFWGVALDLARAEGYRPMMPAARGGGR